MTNDLRTAIRNAEGVLSVARDNEKLYAGLHAQWRDEVKIALRVLERLKEVAGDMPPTLRPLDAAAQTKIAREQWLGGLPAEKPRLGALQAKETAEPAQTAGEAYLSQIKASEKEEVAAPAAPSFRSTEVPAANGFDRLAVKRQCRQWRAGYPLPKSYHAPSQLARQALCATLSDHERYDDWLADGHVHVNDSRKNVGMAVLRNCAKFLGVDAHEIIARTRQLHALVSVYGTPGVDYLWEPR